MFANRGRGWERGDELCLLLCPDVHDVRLYLHSLVKHWSVPFSNPRRLRQKRGYAVMGIIFGISARQRFKIAEICPLQSTFERYIAVKVKKQGTHSIGRWGSTFAIIYVTLYYMYKHRRNWLYVEAIFNWTIMMWAIM